MTKELKKCVVFDTNALVSAALFINSIPAKAFDLAYENYQLIISTTTLTEFKEVLSRDKFKKYAGKEYQETFVEKYYNASNLITTTTKITSCRDPKDNKFLELAVDGNASVIVTGDRDLLDLHPFRDIQILTPSGFLEDFS